MIREISFFYILQFAMKNYYQVLHVEENSDTQEIKKAYKQLAKKHHPDVAEEGASCEQFLVIHQAYEILSDPQSRKKYDADLRQARQPCRPDIREQRAEPSLFDWLFEHQVLRVGFSSRHHILRAEILLTPQEARYGGEHVLSPMVQIPCPICQGLSRLAFLWCPECRQYGVIQQQIHIAHHIPAGVQDQTVEYVSLAPYGLPDVEIEILYRVS